jgi:hypothetical protein
MFHEKMIIASKLPSGQKQINNICWIYIKGMVKEKTAQTDRSYIIWKQKHIKAIPSKR